VEGTGDVFDWLGLRGGRLVAQFSEMFMGSGRLINSSHATANGSIMSPCMQSSIISRLARCAMCHTQMTPHLSDDPTSFRSGKQAE